MSWNVKEPAIRLIDRNYLFDDAVLCVRRVSCKHHFRTKSYIALGMYFQGSPFTRIFHEHDMYY